MVHERKVDVIFAAGAYGTLAALEDEDVMMIGVGVDEYMTTFQKGTLPHSNRLLTSATKSVKRATERILIAVRY